MVKEAIPKVVHHKSNRVPDIKEGGPPAPELPTVLARRTGLVLHLTAQRWNAAVVRGLETLDMRPRHYAVLALLSETGPLSQQEIGRRLVIDRTTMMHIVDDLEQRGLVVRDENPRDRRKYAVRITGTAREVLKKAHGILAAVEKQLLAPLNPAESRQLYQLLSKLR